MCSLEFPDLQTRIYEPFADQDVVVLGLSGSGLFGTESAATVTAFRNQTGVTFPLLLSDDTYSLYANPDGSISPYPLDLILDRHGRIRYLRHEFDPDAMRNTIELLLAED